MRILLLTPFVPHKRLGHGTTTVASNYVDYFSRRHELSILTFYHIPEHLEQAREVAGRCVYFKAFPFRLSRLKKEVRRLTTLLNGQPLILSSLDDRSMRSQMKRLLREGSFDVVHMDTAPMGAYVDLTVGTRAASILLEMDVTIKTLERKYRLEPSWAKRLWYRREWQALRRHEPALCEKFDLVYTVSSEDRALLLSLKRTLNVSVLRFGADDDLFEIPPKTSNDCMLVFVGWYGHGPNVDAAVHFCTSIFPLIQARIPHAKIHLVGGSPPRAIQELAKQPNVVVTGWVPDITAQLALADVGVVPLRSGGGIKTKTLEMMAAARPIVTTGIGCEGLAVSSGEHVFVADDPVEFASRVVELLRDDSLRKSMAVKARALAQREHRWDAIFAQVEHDYERLLAERRTR